jgi:hypothetical protein
MSMTIVRVGLGENKKFAAGYDAVFGKKKPKTPKTPTRAKARKSRKLKKT